jgi:hypothetical protein
MQKQERTGAGVTGSRGRRGRRRAGWCVLGAACGLAVVACGGSSGGAVQAASDAARAAPVSHQLRQRIEAAQDPVGYLVRTTEAQQEAGASGPPAVTTVWTDLATGNAMLQRGSGSARAASWERDYYKNRVLHWDQTQVNYGPRTWWAADDHAGAPVRGPVPSGPVGGGYGPAALVSGVLGKARGKVVGHPVLDGRATIELSVSVAGSQYKLWVDSRTDRIVRALRYFPAMLHFPPMTSDFDWIRASAAMVDRINHPRVPAGFTRIQVGQH